MARAHAMILLGVLLSFLVPFSVHASTSTPARILAQLTQSTSLNVGQGAAFSHCGGTPCAFAVVFTWSNPNSITTPILLDRMVFVTANPSGGAGTGNARAELFPTAAGVPTGTTGLATSANIALSSVYAAGNCGTGNVDTFSFVGSSIQLVTGTTYAAVFENLNTTNLSANADICGANTGTN